MLEGYWGAISTGRLYRQPSRSDMWLRNTAEMKDTELVPLDSDPDRSIRCQEHMEAAISLVTDHAIQSGWSPEEVAAALVELADNHMLALLENRKLALELSTKRK